jgi:hypothetical protein
MDILMKDSLKKLLLSALLVIAPLSQAETVTIEFQLPQLNTSQYQRPFVAVWVEQKGQRQAVKTISVWFDDKKWLKDIRRWWRKAGRYDQAVDGVTGATKPPSSYNLTWDGSNIQGQPLPAGEYTLYLEAVREHGNRTLLKQKIMLGTDELQTYTLEAGDELGVVSIQVGKSK